MKRKTQSKSSKKTSPAVTALSTPSPVSEARPRSKKAVILLAIILLLISGLLYSKKTRSLIVVGKVNKQFVTRWQLEKSMNDRYAKTVFDDLASTTLLKQLAARNDIIVTVTELKQEIASTEKRLGGKEALQSTLERLGYSQGRFEEEMKTQVLVRKLAEKIFQIEITEEEISKFFQDNKTLFPDKSFSDVKDDIAENLKEQKLQQQFSTWFTEEKSKASIQNYL